MNNEQYTNEIEYVNNLGEVKTFQFKLKFLTPELRAKIIKHDIEQQKSYKKLEAELNTQKSLSNSQVLNEKLTVKIEEYLKSNPFASEEQIEQQKALAQVELMNMLTEEDIENNENSLLRVWEFNDCQTINFFKLIVNQFALEKDTSKLFASEYDSDFWLNVDIQKVRNIINSFRTKYSI